MIVGDFHSSFQGYLQQDSQELLSTVLDALHEDLNRVSVKPYIEAKSTDDPENDEISEVCWWNYLSRNQSIIVDLMHGQFKSMINCPYCNLFSVTFDPFLMISLPVPKEKFISLAFTFVPYDLSQSQIKCVVVVEKSNTIADFREKVSSLLHIEKNSFIVTISSGGSFDRFLCRERKINTIIKIMKQRSIQLYLIQINPKYFIESNDEHFLSLEGKEKSGITIEEGISPVVIEEKKVPMQIYQGLENEKTKQLIVDHDDFNNGLPENCLKVVLNIYQRHFIQSISTSFKDRKSFSRIIYVKRDFSLCDLHFEVFRFFKPLFIASMEKKKAGGESEASLSDRELFKLIFPGLEEENREAKLREESDFPYILPYSIIFYFL